MGSNRDFAAPLPGIALTSGYRDAGNYTDCFVADVARRVTLRQYVEAFYTTWVFRLERWILNLLVSRPSTDAEAAELAAGARDEFAAWRVEARRDDQLLLTDYRGNTRSWLMVEPAGSGTRLYFGSVIVAREYRDANDPRLERRFRALLGFHRWYSRVLLRAARRRLE